MISTERKIELFDNAIDWIYEHTEEYGYREYVLALKHIGLTDEELKIYCDEEEV